MPLLQVLRPTLPILIGASLMLTLSMGLRQCFGIFHAAADARHRNIGVAISRWPSPCKTSPGDSCSRSPARMTVRYGFRPIMMVGSLIYIVGPCADGDRAGLVGDHDRRAAC